MKHSQNNRRGGRSRGGSGKRPSSSRHVYESNGPDVKVRGTPQQILDKYLTLARDAQSSGDRVLAESYLQFAEHYFRILSADGQNPARQGQNGHGHQGQQNNASQGEDGEGGSGSSDADEAASDEGAGEEDGNVVTSDAAAAGDDAADAPKPKRAPRTQAKAKTKAKAKPRGRKSGDEAAASA